LVGLILPVLAFAIPVIFQPELRRGLERLGRTGIGNRQPSETRRQQIVSEVCKAAERLAERRHGGLIVLQRQSNLDEYIRTGIPLDSEVSSQLLLTLFWPKTELHDGAAIIDTRGRIATAASVLPLSASRNLPNPNLGTRHRAALGISEVSDAVTVVVSEETGRISITDGGRLIPRLDPKRLNTILSAIYGADRTPPESPREWLREQFENVADGLRDWRKQT
jgi:diadenylate cyclase